jgi:hypothetical protein
VKDKKSTPESTSDKSDVDLVDSEEESSEEQYICRCGNDRDHYMVSPVPTYTAWGTFWVTLMGVSSVPIRIDFHCRVCKENFEFITEPDELKKYM